jgi:tetratricopeptide (TPR) repeat protein
MGPDFRLRLHDLGDVADDPDATRPVGQSDDREALRLLAGAARAEPDDPDYYHILGEALLRAGRVQEAERLCREAVERDPLNPDYRFALGSVLWRLEKNASAETAFREAVQRRPEDARNLCALGAALVRLHREPEAVSTLEKALEIDPLSADAHCNLAVALWGAGDRPGALRCFQRALRLDPEVPDLHRNLALAQRALGRAPEAVSVLRNMIRRWPTQAGVYLDLAEAFHDAGRHAEATRALDEAQRLDPTAIAGRPRSREIRDALRLRGVRGEVERERGPRPGPLVYLLHLPLDLIAYLGALRPRVKVAGSLVLLALLTLGWASLRLLPHYVTSYLIQDDITVIARAPVRDDAIVRDRIAHAVRRRGLDARLDPERCQIETRPGWRQISCSYAVEADILPGLRKTLRFHLDVEEPYLVERDPKIF